MYVIVAPGGVTGWDWLCVGIMFVIDIVSYSGGIGRKRLPGYEGYLRAPTRVHHDVNGSCQINLCLDSKRMNES